jgi:hypothetical protein
VSVKFTRELKNVFLRKGKCPHFGLRSSFFLSFMCCVTCILYLGYSKEKHKFGDL